MDFKSVSDLEKYLLKQISESLQKDVASDGRQLMREHVQDDVYSQYTPLDYERVWGLINSCESSMLNGDTLKLTNTRKGDEGEDVPSIIEYSRGYKWGTNLDERIGERPFIKNTLIDLQNGVGKQFLINSFKKRGFIVQG